MFDLSKRVTFLTLLAVTGCTTLPTGPDVMALPGSNRSFEQFKIDDTTCENYAGSQTSGQSSDTSEQLQPRYDVAYIQCMYSKGHRVPVSGPFSDLASHEDNDQTSITIPAPPEGTPPPPPPALIMPKPSK